MSEAVEKITKEQEEKRLEDFKVIAENWDKFPERVQGKIDGIISMAASAFLKEARKAGQRGDRKKSEKRKKAYRSHLSDNNYMPYVYCDIVKKGNKSYKVGSYIFIYACFSVC